jgi:hypothetical protein
MTGDHTELLKRLEEEAIAGEKKGEYVEAIDCLEKIRKLGLARQNHLIALSRCYIAARQRQDARRLLVQIWEDDPSSEEIVDLLDKNFPGWEKRAGGGKPPVPRADATSVSQQVMPGDRTSMSMPPPPPEDTGGGGTVNLTVETIAAPGEEPTGPRERIRLDDESPSHTGSIRPTQSKPMPAASRARELAGTGAARPQPDQWAGGEMPPVRWDWVLQDAIAEGPKKQR